MGIAATMDENMKKNFQTQKAFQKEIALKQRQAQMAMQLAMGRERFKYFASFYGLSVVGLLGRAIATKNPAVAAPLVPLSFACAYQYDMFYLDMMPRARAQAEKLIAQQPELFMLPENANMLPSQQDYLNLMKKKAS